MNNNLKISFKNIALYIVLTIIAFLMVIPFLWAVSTSFKERWQVFIFPPQWIPTPITTEAYRKAFLSLPLGKAYLNSIKITGSVVIGSLFTASLAAFAFAKIKFKGREAIFLFLLSTMMIPGQVTLIPMYIVFKQINWIDTHLPLIIPPILVNVFGVFFLRQFFMTIPDDLIDAARIDGCSPLRIYFNIILPEARPALATLGIFLFMSSWNDFLTPLIYLNTMEKFTVPLIISSAQGLYYNDWPLMMATSIISIIPILIAYAFAQKYFVEGITLTGIKG